MLVTLILSCLVAISCSGIQPAPDMKSVIIRDIEYAKAGGQSLLLDLYQPQSEDPVPLLIWLHGGGFTAGDKSNASRFAPLFAEKGFAVASVNYRLAPSAHFPAQIHDIKGAIRFLRANASKYNLDAENVGIIGTSAGGTLACETGVTCNENYFEGEVGGNVSYSSCVKAVINCFGSFSYENMMKIGFAPSRITHLEQLFGVSADSPEFQQKIKQAAPEFYLDKNDPPFLILHGEKDTSVPLQNSIDFDKKLDSNGIPSQLITDPGYGHDPRIITAHFNDVMKFLNQHLQ